MKLQDLQPNQLVVLRNGNVGLTASFNGQVAWLIFKSYINPITKYDENLKNKNTNYDIVCVRDGSSIENVNQVFTSKGIEVEALPLVWEEKQ